MDVDYDRVQICEAIRAQVMNGRYPSDPLYGRGDAGQQIANILAETPLRSEKRLAYE